MPAVVVKFFSCSQHSETLLLLQHHLLNTSSQNSLRALRFPACPPRHSGCLSSCSSNSLPSSRRRSTSSSHYSSNSLAARLMAWVDEGTRDGDHAWVRLPLHLISRTPIYWWARDPISVYTVCVQALQQYQVHVQVWQDALATDGDIGGASSACVFTLPCPPSSTSSPHVPPCSVSCTDVRCGCTRERLSITPS
jgi:hypothetical protein